MDKFLLEKESGTVTLEWGTWAMCRFCQLAGNGEELPLSELLGLLNEGSFKISHIRWMIQAAAESANPDLKLTDRDTSAWIDETGGLANADGGVVRFVKWIPSQMAAKVKETGEKKSE